MSEPVIAIADLTRTFGEKTALSSVTISIPRGGVYGLVGANGAGKTTLIKHILGLRRAEHGTCGYSASIPSPTPWACCRASAICRS